MRVVDAENIHSQPFDVPSGLAAILIRKNFVVQFVPPPVLQPNSTNYRISPTGDHVITRFEAGHDLVWSLEQFRDGRPYLLGNCGKCNPRHRYLGPSPENVSVRHNGQDEKIPADLVEKYLALARPYLETPSQSERDEAPVRVPVL